MPTLTLPLAGKSSAHAAVLRWRKKPGDTVQAGEVLLEVETDEGLLEIASATAGFLGEILVPAGTAVAAGAALARIEATAPAGAAVQAAPPPAVSQPKAPAMSEPNRSAAPVKPAGNVIPILMPKPGQSMEEGVLVKWHVQPGAAIKKGDVIFEIETDKATMDVEAADSGRLARILLPEGGSIAVLQPVAFLADNDADIDAFLATQDGAATPAAAAQAVAATAPTAPQSVDAAATVTTDGGRVKASPAARRIAGERGIDLGSLRIGSGPGGRVLSTDVPATAPGRAVASAKPQAGAQTASDLPVPPGGVRKKLSNMRKAIARNLTLSKSTIPHFYISAKIDAGPLLSFYKGQKAKYPCSVNDVVVMACAKAIMEFPAFRSRFDGDAIIEFPAAHIGIAVGMDEGLVVPVLMNAQTFSLERLGEETKRLANAARGGKIENMGLGVFTISNMGMYNVEQFNAIINPPEAAILAVGTAKDDVVIKDGALKIGKAMNLTLSVDHRVIDGALAAQFINRLKGLLEDPMQLLA